MSCLILSLSNVLFGLPELFGTLQDHLIVLYSTQVKSCQVACYLEITHPLLGPHGKGFLFCHVVPALPHRQHVLTGRKCQLPQAI